MMENNLVLPAEIWTEVFGHLSHTQKLISRLVCKEWNRQISKALAKTYFSVESIESHEALLDSDVPWTKLKIGEYSSSGFALTAKFRNLITSIQLKISGLKECVAIVIRFPHLADLDVTIKDDRNQNSKNSEDSEISQELKKSFGKSLEKLRNLSITFPYRHYDALYNLIDGFREAKIAFVGLKIQEEEYSCDYNSSTIGYHSRKCALEQIYSIISKSAQTLISLDLQIKAQGDQFQNLFFSELISKLTTLEGLELQTIRIQAEPSFEYEDRDFTAWQNFLKSQTKIKNVILPWSCRDSLSVSQEFVLSLPSDLESVECLTKDHVTDKFWSTFTKLERMSIVSRKQSMFNSNEQYPSVRVFQINFRQEFDKLLNENADNFYRNLCNSFVNLAELHIVSYEEYYYNGTELQLLIRHLQQLRVLEIDDCHIVDSGVTGIVNDYIEELKITGRIYRCLQVPKEKVVGLPLSSLKSLEKLVLLNSQISDSGIYHGLQFGSKLKHLTFSVNMDDVKVTEWGLHWLAAGNPSLEVFDIDVSLADQAISKSGIEDLRRQLPLVESTGKFRVVNKRCK